MASMTCGELERLVQALSTSRCFVSNFKIWRRQAFVGDLSRSPHAGEPLPAASQQQDLRPGQPDRNVFRRPALGGDLDGGGDPGARSGARSCEVDFQVPLAKPREAAESADKPGSVWDSHSSRRIVTDTLEQPTRRHCGPQYRLPIWPCARWGLPCRPVTRLAVRSYRTISPLPRASCDAVRRYLSVALSVGLRRPGVTWHRALWSPDFPRHPCG